jgi:ketosteroid isomerase-like protein
MLRFVSAFLFAALCAAVISCTDSTPAASSRSASKEELGQMNRGFVAALNAADATKAASYYAEDAVLYPPGEAPSTVAKRSRRYWKGAIESGGVRDATVETIDAKSSGDLGFEVGAFTLTQNGPDGNPVVESGRFVELRGERPTAGGIRPWVCGMRRPQTLHEEDLVRPHGLTRRYFHDLLRAPVLSWPVTAAFGNFKEDASCSWSRAVIVIVYLFFKKVILQTMSLRLRGFAAGPEPGQRR